MTRLGESEARALELLAQDLSSDKIVEDLLAETSARRQLDLSDLAPEEQAELIAGRTVGVLPSLETLTSKIEGARSEGRPLRVKLGIDPTSADVHLGHTVPMIILSRFQRMGHTVVLIIGDITAKIGDPSGRSDERPPLTDEDIARNLSTYRDQVSPFFDFERAEFRHNSEWLAEVRLPELVGILSQIPVSMSLQREDFRTRLAQGHGLAMSEFIYAVVMAIDSVKIDADIELGGVDQLLNMQMGRKVMEVSGQKPQLVISMPLIEGTDGTGAKMSKSKGNYIALTASPDDIFGKIMSIPDRLTVPYLKAWTEWTDTEVDAVNARVEDKSLHPMDLKKIVAGEAVAALHGQEAAAAARRHFTSQFSKRSFGDVDSLPVVDASHGAEPVAAVLTQVLEFTPSTSASRRLAKQNALRVVVETDEGQKTANLSEDDMARPLHESVTAALTAAGLAGTAGEIFLKAGRKVARIEGIEV
ncbi:tyrosine--tRNA ligase [Streptomyces albiflavescens]|uniref:Tyrosine--tRNA ligase n=1 Tax=Streptomyces albiflavescens TaxID=1623582 RepID=A0A917Y443_9ACTN|nr:tyrosine--tRNA ligase [Streptomyces albiflavescens]GGN67358.1 tyrosine--tRNA ligase [Streptomyces albiflavescens]